MKAYAFEQGTILYYKMDMKVKDRFDNQPKIIIDDSYVNSMLPGKYKVHYTAIDRSGNKAQIDRMIIVKKTKI